jgi:hypothetical protein
MHRRRIGLHRDRNIARQSGTSTGEFFHSGSRS